MTSLRHPFEVVPCNELLQYVAVIEILYFFELGGDPVGKGREVLITSGEEFIVHAESTDMLCRGLIGESIEALMRELHVTGSQASENELNIGVTHPCGDTCWSLHAGQRRN